MFFKRSKGIAPGPIEFLIVGLGNPGKNYEFTRHNAGFLTLDHIASELDTEINNLNNNALVADVVINNHRCLLVKPQTFMNNSGTAVRDIAKFYKIPPEKIVVIFDDISLPCGKLRIRRKGTDGGHNGIKSIIQQLGTQNFMRVRVGVGAKPKGWDLADYVLGRFDRDDRQLVEDAQDRACEAVEMILSDSVDAAMNKFNVSKKKAENV